MTDQIASRPVDTGTASSTAGSVQQQAEEISDEAADTIRRQVDERTTDVGRQAQSLAQALRRSADELRVREGRTAAGLLAARAADRIERAGVYFERVRSDDLVHDAERLVRRRTGLAAAAAAVAGFAAARFVKASSDRRSRSTRGTRAQGSEPEPMAGGQLSSSLYPKPPTVVVGQAVES